MAERQVNIIVKVATETASTAVTMLQKAFHGFGKALNGLLAPLQGFIGHLKSLFSIKGLVAGFFAAFTVHKLVDSFIEAAKTAGGYRNRLIVLLGSVEEGNRLFREMADLASKVPKTFEEIMDSATRLAGVMKGGVDEIKKYMPLIIDLSAVTGMEVEEVTGNIIRMYSAGANAAIEFSKKGILSLLGFRRGVEISAEETRKRLIASWEDPLSRFRGASVLLASGWGGLMSMLQDAWFQFRVAVMESGLFDFLKAGLKMVLEEIEKLKAQGKLQEWAQAISDGVVGAIRWTITAIGDLVDAVRYGIGQIVSVYKSAKDLWPSLAEKIPFTAESFRPDYRAAKKELEELLVHYKALNEQVRSGVIAEAVISGAITMEQFSDHVDKFARALVDAQAKVDKYAKIVGESGVATVEADEGLVSLIKNLTEEKAGAAAAAAMNERWTGTVDSMKATTQEFLDQQAEAREKAKWIIPTDVSAPEAEAAKARLILAKGVAKAQEDMQTQFLERGLIIAQQFAARREIMIREQYEAEREALQAQLAITSSDDLGTRQQLAAQIQTLHADELAALMKLDDQVAKAREKKADDDLETRRISEARWLETRTQILVDANADLRRRIEEAEDQNFARQEQLQKEHTDKIIALDQWLSQRIAAVDASADTAALDKAQKDYADQVALLDAALKEELEKTQVGFQNIEAARAQIVAAGEQRVNELRRKAAEQRLKAVQDEAQRARTAMTVAELTGDIGGAMEAARVEAAQQFELLEIDTRAHYDKLFTMAMEHEGAMVELAKLKGEEQAELARINNAKIVAQSIAANEQLSRSMTTLTQPTAEAFGNLTEVFTAFYDLTGKKHKEWAIAMKTTQIAQAIVTTIQAGINALEGGNKISPFLGPIFMATAIAAGMAKVAVMSAQKMAGGGLVRDGTSSRADDVPIMASRGEYVLPADAVNHYGVEFMEQVKRKMVPRFAIGGFVDAAPFNRLAAGGLVQSSAAEAAGAAAPINIVNLEDWSGLDAFVASRPGERIFINWAARNRNVLRSILR